jgi:hypothetical protein
MILQDDTDTSTSTPTATYSREQASRILFDTQEGPLSRADRGPMEGDTRFNFNHHLSQYNQLITQKYADMVTAPAETVPFAAPAPTYDRYLTDDAVGNVPAAAPVTEKYYNDANPVPRENLVPYKSFRPKILADFEDLQQTAAYAPAAYAEPTPAPDAALEPLLEVGVAEAPDQQSMASLERNPLIEPHVRLNAKGLIACVTFFAVTALVVLLIILNSVAIGNTTGRVDALKAENAALTQEYNTMIKSRSDAFYTAIRDAAAEYGVPPAEITLPPLESAGLTPANPDHSTNLFDQICQFFTNLFS